MLKLNDLDGFKLVNIDYLATNDEVVEALRNAFEQGSQGWGVTPEVAIFLSMANQLRVQITLADVADEAQRQLKGEQMGHGRTKKRLEAVENLYDAQTAKITQLTTEQDDLKTECDGFMDERDELRYSQDRQTVVLDK